ncbi:hypothetical protein [Cellvibrio sp. UBA7661]|uniref:hypothetical protein n=1 Tax=Cellvibrio sp. UBA7661 TaxID=1946311 RepID=UPI002F35B735
MKELFTFLVDFDGGTFISQYQEESLQAATLSWAEKLDSQVFPDITEKAWSDLIAQVNEPDNQPVAVSGLKNVWCSSYLVGSTVLIVHIVSTIECT